MAGSVKKNGKIQRQKAGMGSCHADEKNTTGFFEEIIDFYEKLIAEKSF